MKFSREELQVLVKEAVVKALDKMGEETLQEQSNFTAKRHIDNAATNAAMSFENEIVKQLNLVGPDDLPSELQEKYQAVVSKMGHDIKSAVKDAVEHLQHFPKKSKGGDRG